MTRAPKLKAKRGRPCSVCAHSRRQVIDRALVEGEADTQISAKFRGLSDDAVRRHRESHLPATLSRARQAAEVARADGLLAQVQNLKARAAAILDTAEAAGDLRTALGGIREARGCIELLGRLEGEIKDSPMFNVTVNTEWISIQATIVAALASYPQARAALLAALEEHNVAAA
jgi:hypothetical protein